MNEVEFDEQVHLFSNYLFEEITKTFKMGPALEMKNQYPRVWLVSVALCSLRMLAIQTAGLVALNYYEPGKEGLQEEIDGMTERILDSLQSMMIAEIGREAKRLGFADGTTGGITWTMNRQPPRPS